MKRHYVVCARRAHCCGWSGKSPPPPLSVSVDLLYGSSAALLHTSTVINVGAGLFSINQTHLPTREEVYTAVASVEAIRQNQTPRVTTKARWHTQSKPGMSVGTRCLYGHTAKAGIQVIPEAVI